MAYVVHFLRIDPGTDWVDALEALDREAAARAERGDVAAVDILRPDWWRIASLTMRVLPRAELRRTRHGLSFVDRATGLVLDLGAAEYSLSLPFRHDEERAREALEVAQRIARFIEEESGLVAVDPQLGQPFLGVAGGLEHAAALIASTKRALADKVLVRPRRPRDEAGSQRPQIR